RIGDLERSSESLELAAGWVLHSGSVEHLCLYHMVRAQVAKRQGSVDAAECAIQEGLRLANQCGLGLYRIELLCLQAELLLDRSEADAAEASAREAVRMASAADCQFLWGAGEAGHLLGRALARQNRSDLA